MRVSAALLGAAVVASTGLVVAQSQEERLLAQAQASYPTCAQRCMAELIPKSQCGLTDLPCLCTNEDLNARIAICVARDCTTYEGLQTQNVSMTMCGAPVRDKSLEPVVIGMVFGGIALLAFLLRMSVVLARLGRSLASEDYMCMASVLLAGPPTAFAVTLTNNGLGKDMWTLPLDNIKNVLMYYYLGEIFYFAAITTTKLSILLFILRVFPEKGFRIKVYCVCGLVISYGLAFIFATVFQCSPIEWSWQQVDDEWGTGSCNDIHRQAWLSAALNIIIDLVLLVLPLPSIWCLQMRTRKKVQITLMFCLGIFVTVISVIRLRSLVVFANSHNITWDYSEAAWWSTLEIHMGIICASLPSVRQLLLHLGATVLGTTKATTEASQAHARSRQSAFGSGKLGNSSGKSNEPQQVPRHGDEGDFVPLVNYRDKRDTQHTSKYGYDVNIVSSSK